MARGTFTSEQITQLLKPIKPQRVLAVQGHSHVSQQDITAHLIRMFGFGNFDIDFSHPADSDRCLIAFQDGTTAKVNQQTGIIEDICHVNVLLQKEERVAVCQ